MTRDLELWSRSLHVFEGLGGGTTPVWTFIQTFIEISPVAFALTPATHFEYRQTDKQTHAYGIGLASIPGRPHFHSI